MTTREAALARERPYLIGVAYRMLGSASDAEDLVQEALARAPEEDEVRSLRAYLTTVLTRLCLDELRSARRRRVRYLGPWLPEPVFTDELDAPGQDALAYKEHVSVALLVVLEELSPLSRAVFVLREVFDLELAEVAQALGRSEPACRKLLSRARARLAQRQGRPPAPVAAQGAVAAAFLRAVATGDLAEVVRLLTDEAVAITDHGGKARAARRPVVGPARIARFLVGLARKASRLPTPPRLVPALVCGAPALLAVRADGAIDSALILRIERSSPQADARIAQLAVVRNPDKLRALARGAHLTALTAPAGP